jgi:hypothetical protein
MGNIFRLNRKLKKLYGSLILYSVLILIVSSESPIKPEKQIKINPILYQTGKLRQNSISV